MAKREHADDDGTSASVAPARTPAELWLENFQTTGRMVRFEASLV